jgi:hypothetical protein
VNNETINQFDNQARQLHAEALANISPQTLAKLRTARHAATQPSRAAHGWRWLLAGAVPALLAVAIGVQFLLPSHPVQQPAAPAQATTNNDDYTHTVGENPALYLWLESNGQQWARE